METEEMETEDLETEGMETEGMETEDLADGMNLAWTLHGLCTGRSDLICI
jgi:hypothetical protein